MIFTQNKHSLSRKSNNQHGVDPIDLKYYCMSNVTDISNFITLSLPTNVSQIIKRPFQLGLSMKLSRPNPNRRPLGGLGGFLGQVRVLDLGFQF